MIKLRLWLMATEKHTFCWSKHDKKGSPKRKDENVLRRDEVEKIAQDSSYRANLK